MIFPVERHYGWGAGGIPMPPDAAGHRAPQHARPVAGGAPLCDLPWRPLLASLLLTVAGALALIFLARHLSPVAEQATRRGTEITMRLPTEAPAPPPEPLSRPALQKTNRRKLESPPQQPPPLPKPPPPTMLPLAPRTAPLPPPIAPPVAQKRSAAAEPPTPRHQAFPRARQETTLGPAPDLRPRSGRQAEESLPAASMTMNRPATVELPPDDGGVLRPRIRRELAEAGLPSTARRQTLAAAAEDITPGPAPRLDARRFERQKMAAPDLPTDRRDRSLLPPAAAEMNLPPVVAAVRTAPAASSPLPTGVAGAFDFLDRLAPAELDQTHLVSLNRLRTCLDPGEEMRLRTRLASMLSRPGVCRSGGVIFDIRQPESAWSVHIDIYNYEKKEFHDRCDALQLAVSGCAGGGR